MHRIGAPAGMLLATLLLSGCQPNSLESGRQWDSIVSPAVLAKADLELYWRFRLELDGDSLGQLWRLDENLYALGSSGRLYCLDALAGVPKWSQQIAGPAERVYPPCHADGVIIPDQAGIASLLSPPDRSKLKPFNAVLINTLSYALLLDRDTGQVRRKLGFAFAANTGGSSDGFNFYVGSVRGRYYAVRLSEGLAQWEMATGDVITATPKVSGHRLYVASQDHKFYDLAPERQDDRHVWTRATDGPLTAEFVVDPRGCFVPSQDYNLYAFDPATGEELWSFLTQGALLDGVQVGARSAFQYANKDRFYAVDIATGRQRWENKDARTVLAVMEPNVLALTADRNLLVINEVLGEPELSLPLTGLRLFVPNAAKPVIYAGTADGRFVCIRKKGAGKLTADTLRETAGELMQPLVPEAPPASKPAAKTGAASQPALPPPAVEPVPAEPAAPKPPAEAKPAEKPADNQPPMPTGPRVRLRPSRELPPRPPE